MTSGVKGCEQFRTDDLREPSEGGRTPIGLTCRANILPEEKGVEEEFGGLEIAQGIFTGTGAIANGFGFYPGNVDEGEITRAHDAGQLRRVPAVGFHPVAGLLRDQ
jgi:hypothetical protein